MATTELVRPTAVQYRVLQTPVVIPTPAELFDYMVETLVAKGLASYEHADPFRGRLPVGLFLLVPPQPDPFDLAHLLSLVDVQGKTGRNYLDPEQLSDVIETPVDKPYLMVNVEDGAARRNIQPSVSAEAIRTEGRSPYTTWRGIVHAAVFPEVFQSHNMDLVGSLYGSGRVPLLYLFDVGPRLRASFDDYARPKWGAPSCGSVLVP
jgi:Family of unknown function (DUF5701)